MSRPRSAYRQIRWVKRQRAGGAASFGLSNALARAVDKVGEPMIEASPLEEARMLLCAAAEIEQQLMLQYLYALYSLEPTPPAGWANALRKIAHEEMGHLLTVQNLLLLLGAEPHLLRLTPDAADLEPFPFRLEPLTRLALAKYVRAESPRPESLPADLRQRGQPAFDEAEAAGLTGDRVGVLYAKITWLFQQDDHTSGPWEIDPGEFKAGRHLAETDFVPENFARQGTAEDWRMGDSPAEGRFSVRCENRAEALAALHDIAEQGEGLTPTTEEVDSHFERFLTLYEEAKAIEAAGQALPVRPVPVDPTYGDAVLPDAEREAARIDAPISRLWAQLSDVHYTLLLALIALSLRFKKTDPSDTLREELAEHSITRQMRHCLLGVGNVIRTRPRKDGIPETASAAALPFSDPEWPADNEVETWKTFLRDWSLRSDALVVSLRAAGDAPPALGNIVAANEELRALAQRLPVT